VGLVNAGVHLNGWQRIGIVLSVLWLIVGGLWGNNSLFNPIYQRYSTCVSPVGIPGYCISTFESQLADARSEQLAWIALYGLARSPLCGWRSIWSSTWCVG
jgi:hypothetical protein